MPKPVEKTGLAAKFAKAGRKTTEPLWKGPEKDGVTQSLLSRFLVCPERFRVLVVEGLKPAPRFNHRLEYGNLWHACEEELARTKATAKDIESGSNDDWARALKQKASTMAREYPLDQELVKHWYYVCREQFPRYVRYWTKQPDNLVRTPLMQEVSFAVPYKLPSGRTVTLRGKWDSVDIIGTGKSAALYVQENKTKGDIDELAILRQLGFDLQAMLYIVALHEWQKQDAIGDPVRTPKAVELPVRGVRYNVVRRPLSGGKGNIKQHKPSKSNPQGESLEEYYARLGAYFDEYPEEFFMRWKADVSAHEVEKFKHETLDPLLERLWDWWEYIHYCSTRGLDPFAAEQPDSEYPKAGAGLHYRAPFGIYNPLLEGGSTEYDSYLSTGSKVGLQRVDTLYPELE